jgi:hypothetical protein
VCTWVPLVNQRDRELIGCCIDDGPSSRQCRRGPPCGGGNRLEVRSVRRHLIDRPASRAECGRDCPTLMTSTAFTGLPRCEEPAIHRQHMTSTKRAAGDRNTAAPTAHRSAEPSHRRAGETPALSENRAARDSCQ